MRFALVGFVQNDVLNPDILGITPSENFVYDLQYFIESRMTEDNGYLNVVYAIQSNGRKEEEYAKSKFADTISTPFCIENTEGYEIPLELAKQAPIPRYFLKTTNFDLLDESLEIRPFRIAGDFVAHVVGKQPSFAENLKSNVSMGFNQYELVGAWTKDNLLITVRKLLERGAEVTINPEWIASDEPWVDALKSYCYSFVDEQQLIIE